MQTKDVIGRKLPITQVERIRFWVPLWEEIAEPSGGSGTSRQNQRSILHALMIWMSPDSFVNSLLTPLILWI